MLDIEALKARDEALWAEIEKRDERRRAVEDRLYSARRRFDIFLLMVISVLAVGCVFAKLFFPHGLYDMNPSKIVKAGASK